MKTKTNDKPEYQDFSNQEEMFDEGPELDEMDMTDTPE